MLDGKVALVTGSTSGIGLGVARALAAQRCKVMLNGFGEAGAIERLRSDLSAELGVEVAYHGADLSRPDEIQALIEEATRRFGGIDILVNNAGIQHVDPIEAFPPERWDLVLAINLSALFHTIRLALPQMKARNWGRIVNISSTHGLVASVNKAAYVAAKHGVVGLTKVVGLETAETGITCNAIAPGWVLTPLVQAQVDARAEREGIAIDAAKRGLLSEKQPSKQFVTPEQIGAAVVFLCSPAGEQIRGTTIAIDGGWTAQ